LIDWKMDIWKYYDITHRRHALCNPISPAKLDALLELLDLEPGDRVVDIACGKGEMLVRLAERCAITGVGVDISPPFVAACKARLQERMPDADIEFLLMDGAEYRPASPASFRLAASIGASWVFGGHRGTLRALKAMVAPDGLVLVGEPFWMQEPAAELLAAEGVERDAFSGHPGNVAIAEEEGLVPLYAVVSNPDEWDVYEALQWQAADQYALSNPDDPDVPALLDRVETTREAYLKWGRDTLGFALYLFRKAADG